MSLNILYFYCGKMGAGKTTHSRKLASNKNAVIISEDEWLARLYPDQIETFDDYLHYSSRLKPLLRGHVANTLRSGSPVVMDYPANTPKQRQWFVELANHANTVARLIYLKASDELCLQRLATRRIEQPERAAFDNETVFAAVTRRFQEPSEQEGIDIQVIEIAP